MDRPATELTHKQLQVALDRCMKHHPPVAPEFVMHEDANRIADLWVPMLLDRVESIPLDQVKPAALDAIRRWSLSEATTTGGGQAG